MSNKWLTFHTSHSPVEINIDSGQANITADWSRLNWKLTFIDGQSLDDLMNHHEISKESLVGDQGNQILRQFFSNVILAKYQGSDKIEALDTLMKTFHQGGLLHPVSAGMCHVLKNEVFGAAGNSPRQVNIRTSTTGFAVQEIYTVKQCQPTVNAENDHYELFEDGIILPDAGNDYVLQAQATIDVSFNKGQLKANVINQGISYGNEYVKNRADSRSWMSKLVDFFKNLFGANSVKDLSSTEENQKTTDDPVWERPQN